MKRSSFRSFAKINLGLEVVGKLPGGFHELKTLFATLSLHDTLDIEERRGAITVSCDHPGVPGDETNLAWRAAALMQKISGRKTGVAIRIHKRIAMGAGLGGGSSNAATVLRALDRMWDLGLGPSGLLDSARSLGADVPYFLVGGPALGLGRGDDIHPLDLNLPGHVLLVPGAGGVSTADVFRRFSSQSRTAAPPKRIDRFLTSMAGAEKKAFAPKFARLRNHLERAALKVSPALARTARKVRQIGRATSALQTAMSGSGSSFFLVFADKDARSHAAVALKASGLEGIPCSFLSRSAFLNRFETAARRG